MAALAFAAAAVGQGPPLPVPAPAAAPPNSRTVYFQKDARPIPTTALSTPDALMLAAMQADNSLAELKLSDYNIEVEPPRMDRLYRLESEAQLQARIKREAAARPTPEQAAFPPEPVLSTVAYSGRSLAPMTKFVEPGYVAHDRLLFEEKNTERYAWNLGILQPVVSTGAFLGDFFTVPYHLATRPHQQYETGAGWCLPGDPVPYLLYPPEFSVTGGLAEAGAAVALFALIP